MQKIILLIDPRGIDKPSLEFASYLAGLGSIKLYGLFLHPESPVLLQEVQSVPLGATEKIGQSQRNLKRVVVPAEDSKKEFLAYCKNQGFSLPPETADAFTKEQIIEETRFADAIIISAESSFSGSPRSIPSRLSEFILKVSECPVIVAPLSFDPIEEIVFAYDGSASSVFAIREFTRVFPQFEDMRVTFLEVNFDESSLITNQERISDYLKLHYSAIGYRVLHGNAENELFDYFLEKKNTFLVLGAYGRSQVSSLVRRSSASLLLKTTTLPLFIAHR
jgi:nucleotide-binding universal stress UspA family protein